MKQEIENMEKTYRQCRNTGDIREKNKDIELARSLKNVAERGLEFIKSKSRGIPYESTDWTFVFRDYYESLRMLIEARLLLDKREAGKHQSKNASICFEHPEIGLDWEFLETIRLTRNWINYRGLLLKYEDWKQFRPNFELHINALKKEIENLLG